MTADVVAALAGSDPGAWPAFRWRPDRLGRVPSVDEVQSDGSNVCCAQGAAELLAGGCCRWHGVPA